MNRRAICPKSFLPEHLNFSRPVATGNRDLGESNSSKELENQFVVREECNAQLCVTVKKSLESKSFDDHLSEWIAKNDELGFPKLKSFLPFLVGAPKLAECLVCESVIYPGEEISCVVRDCKGSYHLSCARDWLGFSQSSKAFKCPQHVCFLCKKSFHLWRCSRCHLASHDKCAAYPEYVSHSKDHPWQKICWRHAIDWPPLKPAVPTNSMEEFFCRLPLPYTVKEFTIDLTLKDPLENKLEPHITLKDLVENKREPPRKNAMTLIGIPDALIASLARALKIVYAVISDAECEERLWNMKDKGNKNFYMCEIRKDFTIDATFKGNASRFLNHSCGPNCNLEKWDVDGETRVGVFAARSIKVGEPLTYDYRFVQFGPEVKCHCGASCCQGYLGSKKKIAKSGLVDWGAKRRRTATASFRVIRP
ncbi:hypothetical protein L1987_54315 [Smallanthus sonchifolius]|uniref:Uncharacterized protein n=1 Tax=Smallanthus sonchifolius TaxID=185202 RepID=A0ACB9E6P7_9ASTR|nr:hypothetical protein L1987_54315 [Smallanthus sonchifolius]